jgi:AcrR family transcriptional regulator
VPKTPYHHGNLRAELIRVTLEVIERDGPTNVSLRAVAKLCGVSHGAPAHHFGDKAGLLTAVAAEGFGLLADALAQAREETDDFAEVGVAYVRFAVEHRAHFEVMFRPELYRPEDPSVLEHSSRAATELSAGSAASVGKDATTTAEAGFASLAAWALVHGLATLWIDGNLDKALAGDDPVVAAREVARLLGRTE